MSRPSWPRAQAQKSAQPAPTLRFVAPAIPEPPLEARIPPLDPREELARYCSAPWPLNEDDLDLPTAAPDPLPPPPDNLVTVGTFRAAFGMDARYGYALNWHDLEVRVDRPCVEVGSYVLTRKEAIKLRLWLELALYLLNDPEAAP